MASNRFIRVQFNFYQFEDDDASVIASGPTFTVLNSTNENVGTGNLPAGTYQIVPSNVVLKTPI